MKRGATKEEIIRITQALIARNGIRAVRVDEIAQTLGISKRTLYEMFADKDDLINACLDAMSSKQRERIATYRKQRSGSALQRTFKLAYEYIANLYMVESSFLSDLRHKIIYADHFDEHREFWRRELAHHLEASKEEGLLLPEIEGASFADFQRLRDMAAHVPYDYIYVLSNTQKYGGGGIFNFYGISAAHHPTRTGKIHVHEFGHLLLGLGDEYVGTTSYDDMYAKSIEPWEPNLTTLVGFEDKFWSRMVAEGTPVPTPDTEEYDGVVGVFEGGGYAAEGVYRPWRNCLMNNLHKTDELCPVCSKAIVDYIDFLCK